MRLLTLATAVLMAAASNRGGGGGAGDQDSQASNQPPVAQPPAPPVAPPSAEKPKHVRMKRHAPQNGGGPVTADVHPDEVANYEQGGWHQAPEPAPASGK